VAAGSQQLRSRDLVWDGCLNVRDLGGLPTRDGGLTRFGAIVRADSVRQLSTEGWHALADHGVRTVIDLRSDQELLDDPPADVRVSVLHVPMMKASEEDLREIDAEIEAAATAAPDTATGTRDVYLVFLDHFEANVAAAVRAIAEAPEGGVVIHCAGGKDRTGILVAFILDLAGVDAETIAADYALSEERLRPRHEKWFAAAETEEELERLRRVTQTPAESMSGLLSELERRHGGVAAFLRSIGVSDDDLERVRARLSG
jgi:protein tyrosine/serine phosphatase